MAQPYVKAFKYIADFVQSLLPDARLERVGTENLAITNGDARAIARFGNAELGDLERALADNQPVRYTKGIKHDINFHIYMVLGTDGMIPAMRISSAMLEEERDWRTNISLDTYFDPQLAKQLNGGLKALAMFLDAQLAGDIEVPELQHDIEVIKTLTDWYAANGNLNSPGATAESLSYLKAAGVCVIMDLERKRDDALGARVQEAYNNRIYEIVRVFHSEPYRWIRLPNALYEYAKAASRVISNVSNRTEERRQEAQIRLDVALSRISTRLVERRLGAWKALASDNPDRFSQAANSMVEVLDQVIEAKCGTTSLREFLDKKYPSHQQTDWIQNTRAWISATKSSLQATKHETNSQSEVLTEALMLSAEGIMLVVLG